MANITKKTAADITALRKLGKIAATILNELEKEAIAGNTSLDIDDRAMELIAEYEVEPMILGYHPRFAPRPYPAATCVSINDVLVHGIPNEDPEVINEGDVVSIDLVIGKDGYVVDSARTVGVGAISPEAVQLIEVTKAALKAGVAAAKPGNYVGDIGKAIEAVVPKGFGIVEALCGHGVGFDVHEEPTVPNFVTKDRGPKLEPGMVLAIEPMIIHGSKDVIFDEEDGYTVITADGGLGAHMEHTVYVGEKGPEILTS